MKKVLKYALYVPGYIINTIGVDKISRWIAGALRKVFKLQDK